MIPNAIEKHGHIRLFITDFKPGHITAHFDPLANLQLGKPALGSAVMTSVMQMGIAP